MVHIIFLLDSVHLQDKDPEITQRITKSELFAKFTNIFRASLREFRVHILIYLRPLWQPRMTKSALPLAQLTLPLPFLLFLLMTSKQPLQKKG